LAAVVLASTAASVAAQPAAPPRVSGDVGVAVTRLDGSSWLGTPITAYGARAAGHLPLRGQISLSAEASVLLPQRVYAVTPGCTSGPCQGGASPERIDALSLRLGVTAYGQRVRLSAGVGTLRAVGAEPGPTTTSTREVAIELRPFGTQRWRPVVALRATYLGTPIAGMRTLIAPGVGVAF
jgi:hypothetical protein